jgi:hypothetical protein
MPSRLSEVFGISAERFAQTGAFDAFVGVDARLHVDAHLLAASAIPEMRGAREHFDAHFAGVLKLLAAAKSTHDPFFRQAVRRLTFREIPNTGLGYSRKNKRGSAIGEGLATDVAELGKAIVDAGVSDPDIFSLMGLLQDGIGADRISDMTAAVTFRYLLAFSTRVVAELDLPSRGIQVGEREYRIPVVPRTREAIVLVPRDILRHLSVAESWTDIDTVASHNAALRERANRMIGSTWRIASRRAKHELRTALLREPELLQDLLQQYKAKPARAYDLEADPAMLYQWQPETRAAAAEAPLPLALGAAPSHDDIVAVVRALIARFKDLVEANRLYRLLYNDDGEHRNEKIAQLALFGIADSYCAANDLDLSPEVDSGAGPVDFKVSRGYTGRVLVEVKLSSNSKILPGYEKQVEAYSKAERAYHAFYVVVRIDETSTPVNDLVRRVAKLKQAGVICPELIIIDARPSASASKRK